MEILCFFAGNLFFYTHAYYPLIFVMACAVYFYKPGVLVWFAAAFSWGIVHQWLVADQGMPAERLISEATIVGIISSIPIKQQDKTQFQLSLSSLNNQAVSADILLSCYNHCPEFKVSQQWQLIVKLKRPENLANPGYTDFKARMAANHIHWIGYLKNHRQPLLMNTANHLNLLAIRVLLADKLNGLFAHETSLGIVQALTLGVTTHITSAEWELFRRTGTTHLMVISGSHIALIAGFTYWIFIRIWSCYSPMCLYRPATQIASLASLLVALSYSLLAGFAIPSQRSLLASIFMLMPCFLNYRLTTWQAWRYALFCVLLVEPHAVLMPGFYLSFIAVALLISCHHRIPYLGVRHGFLLQLACLFGLMPFTLYWFSYGALTGLPANLIAIPWVGYVIVPLSLVALLIAQVWPSPELFLPLDWFITKLMTFLTFINRFEYLNLTQPLTSSFVLLGSMFALAIIVFLPLPKLWPSAIVIIITAFFPSHLTIKPNQATINILDVGQGLAIVVSTAKHTLIYDTGMKFFKGKDMAQMAILPYLALVGVKKIDMIVISHPDLDHRGGLDSLMKAYPVKQLVVDDVKFYHRGYACHQYPLWHWDGITFEFLPLDTDHHRKNNSSCVLKISGQHHSVLLTGDIEKQAERELVKTQAGHLQSEVLVVAHHGSKTSSTPSFIDKVSPSLAIISAGFDNRYHFPHPKTIELFTKRHITIVNTITCGMVTINLFDQKPLQPRCFRNQTG